MEQVKRALEDVQVKAKHEKQASDKKIDHLQDTIKRLDNDVTVSDVSIRACFLRCTLLSASTCLGFARVKALFLAAFLTSHSLSCVCQGIQFVHCNPTKSTPGHSLVAGSKIQSVFCLDLFLLLMHRLLLSVTILFSLRFPFSSHQSALATIDLLNSEKQSLQQQFTQLQQLLDDERALRNSEAQASDLRLQQKDTALEVNRQCHGIWVMRSDANHQANQ